jgi:hypothetical protein
MGKYSKSKLVKKRYVGILVFIVSVLFVLGISLILFVNINNYISYGKVIDNASQTSDDIAIKSTPIIINNMLLGAIYENKFVSSERYFFKSTNKENIDMNVYSSTGKTGTFKLSKITKDAKSSNVIAAITRNNYTDEYIAFVNNTNYSGVSKLDETRYNEFVKSVKSALGFYYILNMSIKIDSIYEITLKQGETSYLVFVTNDGNVNSGVYNSVIYFDSNKNGKCIKYNYVKNINNASEFGIYSLKFVIDINGDNVKEIVLQETKEFKTNYLILQNINNEFYQVLSSEVK